MAKAAIARTESYENMDVMIVSDDEENCEETHSGSDTEYVEIQETNKRERKRKCKSQRSRAHSETKRGRPPTTGEYVNLAEAKKALNEQKKIEALLEWEKKVNAMTPEQLLSNMGIDLENAVENMKQNPTADVASRAREGMVEVLRVARKSKNLHGLCVKDLKMAAVRGAEALEVLRSRADNDSDNDVPRRLERS